MAPHVKASGAKLSEARVPARLRLIFFLASVALLGAGDAGKAYREGKDLDEAGSDYKAAVKYLEALDADSGHKKALEAVRLVAKDAYEEKLADAKEAEASRAFPEALTDYKELVALVHGLKEFDAVSFEVGDLAGKVQEMTEASAEAAYARSTDAFGKNSWEVAIKGCAEATTFLPGYKDCGERVPTAYYRWAEGDLAAKHFRDAATHFEASAKAGSTSDAGVRAAGIHEALASYFVGKGACRQGVDDAKAAEGLHSSPEVTATLAAARACAVTPIAMGTVENPTGVKPAGMAVGDLLADAILAETQRGASEYLQVMDRSALDSLLMEQGISSTAAGTTPKGVKGVRYLVLGKITQLQVVNEPVKGQATAVTASQSYDCTRTKSDGTTVAARCSRDVQVLVDQYSGKRSATLAMSLRVIDVETGKQVVLENLTSTKADAVVYGQNLRTGTGQPLGLSLDGRDGTVVSRPLQDLLAARKDLAGEGEIMKAVLGEVATAGGIAILRAVDHPPAFRDPDELPISMK